MRRRRPYRDSTAKRASLSDFGRVLNAIRDRRERGMLILLFIWGISFQEACRRLGVSERDGQVVFGRAMSHLRHPSRSQDLREELDEDGDPVKSVELRRWAEAAGQGLVIICEHCGRRFVPEHLFKVTGGRPPRFCTNVCRQRAYRARKKAAAKGAD